MFSLLLFSLLLLPAFGQFAPDYDNPYSLIFTDKPVYSWTDKMKITIISPSWNSDRHLIDSIGETNEHAIKIATSEHSLEPYRFTETDVNSGIFTAEVFLQVLLMMVMVILILHLESMEMVLPVDF